ncbi:MAG: hypothetical protein V4540_03900 [Pseudomonadota bacterium]|jgi:Ca2+/Na+ antiporter
MTMPLQTTDLLGLLAAIPAAAVGGASGHDDVGLGTLLGSNLFNGLAVVGVAATSRGGRIPRRRGLLLLAACGAFVFVTAAKAR